MKEAGNNVDICSFGVNICDERSINYLCGLVLMRREF